MTIWQRYNKDNDFAAENDLPFVDMTVYVGLKVNHVIYEGDKESWSEDSFTITYFDDNLCGDGCCSGFSIEGSNETWDASQLRISSQD